MVSSILKGLWTTLKIPKLVLLLWIWNLMLALAAAWPARAWFRTALDTRVETESMLTRFNIGTLADMNKYSDVVPFTFLMASMVGVALVALVGNAFVNGGILEVLASEHDSRTFMHRFFRGGGHFFWRFVRLSAVTFVSGAIVVGIVAAGLAAVTTPLSDSEWEPAGIASGVVTLAVAGLVALWFLLALDYGRIRVAREGHRGMMRAFLSALGFIRQHVFATYGIAVLALVGTCSLLLAYVAHEAMWGLSTWAAIAVFAGVQQVIMLARTGIRVMQVSAEWHYFATVTPAAATGAGMVFPIQVDGAPAVCVAEVTERAERNTDS